MSKNQSKQQQKQSQPQQKQPQQQQPQQKHQKQGGVNSKKKQAAREPSGFFQRLIGVITLNRHIYREIAEDPRATMQAALIVIVVALIVGAISYYGAPTQVPGISETTSKLGNAVMSVIQELVVWVAGAFVIAQAARYLFKGSTDTNEMLRVFGYTRIFQILLVLGVFSSTLAAIVSIAGLALSIIGSIIGIREAGEFDTGKAVLTGVFAIVLVMVLVGFVRFMLNPFVATLFPT